MAQALTLMAVHAHPDDEASSTGGILARYAAEGVRTVVVTCTNGELGDGLDGVKPGEPGHDEAAVVAQRMAELRRACETLDVGHLELLGFRDSGMAGWEQNARPDTFAQTPVAAAADRLAAVLDRYRPQVVVTYDANGFYGHPDHIQAHRVTVAAVARAEAVRKLYFTAVPRSVMEGWPARLRELGLEPADVGIDFDPADPPFGTPDELVTTAVDVAGVVDRKRAALACHASQVENAFFLRLPEPAFRQAFAREFFVRDRDSTGAPLPEDDLFAGLR